LDDLDDLAGYVAAEANHAKNKKLQKELQRLFSRIASLWVALNQCGGFRPPGGEAIPRANNHLRMAFDLPQKSSEMPETRTVRGSTFSGGQSCAA
jgi:hypothetical protein